MTSKVDKSSPPATKEELPFFQARRDKWQSRPRPALRKLPPASSKIDTPETLLAAVEAMKMSSPKRTKSFSPTRNNNSATTISSSSVLSTPTRSLAFTTTKSTLGASPFGSLPSTSSSSPFGTTSGTSQTPTKIFGAGTGLPAASPSKFSTSKATNPKPASSSLYPPSSSVAPSAFQVGAQVKDAASSKPSTSAAAFPPSSSKAPTPFGGSNAPAVSKVSTSAAYPPTATIAPKPFGGNKAPATSKVSTSAAYPPSKPFEASTTAPKSSSTSAYPPASKIAPKAFGAITTTAATAPKSSPSPAYPPVSKTAPKPYKAAPAAGVSTKASAASSVSSAYPPMSEKAPAPFGGAIAAAQKPKPTSAAAFPPTESKTPSVFGGEKNANPKPTSAAAFPPMASKAPTPFRSSGSDTKAKPSSTAAAFPPASTQAPTSFDGGALAQNKTATASAFGASTTPSPFGNNALSSSPSASPFGASSLSSSFGAPSSLPTSSLAPKSSVSSSYPPSASKVPTPFGGAATTSTSKSDYRSRLVAFYEKHNPSKVDTVDATLEKYRGKEEELFQKLKDKYEGQFPPPSGDGPRCFLEFSVDGVKSGRVAVKLYQDKVPLTADNFKCLCTGEKGMGRSMKPLCYKGSKVHRIVPSYCVQMGDFTKGNGTGGESIYPPNSEHGDAWGKFKDESFMKHSKPGLLSMANNGKNTNSSQIFFTLKPVSNLDGKHVVFGEIVEGMEVIESLGKLETNGKQNPIQAVTISGCGEIVDGKDIPCKIQESKPFGVSGSAFGQATTPSPFGASGKSPFGATTTAAPSPGGAFGFGQNFAGGTFSFGQSSAPSAGTFAFGKTSTTSFGVSSPQKNAADASLFSTGPRDNGSSSSAAPSIFSFSNSNAAPSFGSLSAAQSQEKPFSFGKK